MSRINISDNIYIILFNEVSGSCPLCGQSLSKKVNGKYYKRAEAAHIYPHSPSQAEIDCLKNVPRISDDSEAIENLILLCPGCHNDFDKPRTEDGYMRLFDLKSKLLKNSQATEYYLTNNIEEEIVQILSVLYTNISELGNLTKLSYSALTINSKVNKKINMVTQNRIEQLVVNYYYTVTACIQELEKNNSTVSNIIASEVKVCYQKLYKQNYSFDEIFSYLIDWIDQKTFRRYTNTVEIVVAYYVQNCEVFS